jgi:hypothetical protein
MRSLTDGLIGVIARRFYRIEVWEKSAPKLAVTDQRWFYITKIHHNGEIGERSIGVPESDLTELIDLLTPQRKIK